MRLTAKTIDALKLPAGRHDHIFWDDEFPGFSARIREGGSRTAVLQYALGGKQRRMTLCKLSREAFKTIKGMDGEMVQAGLRERVADLLARVRLGGDPAGEREEKRQKAGDTFLVIGKRWLAARKAGLHGEKVMRLKSYATAERHILVNCKPHRAGSA